MVDYKLYFNMDLEAKEMFDSVVKKLLETLKAEREERVAGYYELPYNSPKIVDRVLVEMESNSIYQQAKQIVLIGIGGSSLGAKAVDKLLRKVSNIEKEFIVFENPDPIEVFDKLSKIDRDKAIFIVASKSGETVETISLFKVILDYFKIDLTKDSNRFIVITDKNSNLDKFANHHNIGSFNIPENVGGRFSVLSAVGVVPLTLLGYDTKEMLQGAKDFLDRFWAGRELHLLQKALFLSTNWEEFHLSTLFAYSSCFEDFSKWWIQLWGESLGKIDRDGNRVGLTPIAHIGSIDQHSFLQLIIDGPKDKSLTFLKVSSFEKDLLIPEISLKYMENMDFLNGHTLGELLNGECDATFESIKSLDIPLDLITIDALSPENVGEMVIYYQLLTSAIGTLLNIDTYNQPGVERWSRDTKRYF